MSATSGDLSFITDQDLEQLEAIATEENRGGSGPVAGSGVEDPAESAPERCDRVRLTRVQSRALYELSERTTNAEAADRLGVSVRTVERHRAHWNDGDDAGAVTFEGGTSIDDRMCGAMRCMAEDGATIGEVADFFDVSAGAVHNHVSASAGRPCSHTPEVEVPRVDFDHGGERGNPDREVCAECGRFKSGVCCG